MRRRMRIGVDVGGTFTDAVSVNEHGHVWTAKTLRTPDDVSRAGVALPHSAA
jgi:N-methylhydantoinase A/oxoprolinase/acetone carboxylase beta subunit